MSSSSGTCFHATLHESHNIVCGHSTFDVNLDIYSTILEKQIHENGNEPKLTLSLYFIFFVS